MDTTSYLLGKKSSGGGSVGTLDELNSCVKNYFDTIERIPNNYKTLSNQAKTFYTPDTNKKQYAIYKSTNGRYRIGWFNKSSAVHGIAISLSGVYYSIGVLYTNFVDSAITISYSSDIYSRSNDEFNTIEECILAMQDNTTSYTNTSTSSSRRVYDENAVVLSNASVFYFASTTLGTEGVIKTPQRISSNETIEAIS